MRQIRNAPPIIAGLYVLAFAHVDRSVQFEQRHTLNVGGKWLGRVQCLALCQAFDGPEFMLQHCSNNWYPLGIAAGYKTIKEAKERAERSYHGIAAKWKRQSVPKRKARAIYKAKLKAASCSFCGRTPLECKKVAGSRVRVCNYCVDSIHAAMHTEES